MFVFKPFSRQEECQTTEEFGLLPLDVSSVVFCFDFAGRFENDSYFTASGMQGCCQMETFDKIKHFFDHIELHIWRQQ